MVSEKKVRIQVTLNKVTLETIDNLIKKLEKENPMGGYSRSSVLEGAFIAQCDQMVKDYEAKLNKEVK